MIAYHQRPNLDAGHAGDRGRTDSPVIECATGGEIRPRVGHFTAHLFSMGNTGVFTIGLRRLQGGGGRVQGALAQSLLVVCRLCAAKNILLHTIQHASA